MYMTQNDLLILGAACVDLLFVLFVLRFGKEWLYGILTINLILISTFGAKLIPVSIFEFITNAGNVFYAVIFFTIHVLVEHYGKSAAQRGIWFSSVFVILYVIMSDIARIFVGSSSSESVNIAIYNVFGNTTRFALASILAYLVAQYFNIWFYDLLREKFQKRFLWYRDTASNILGQLLDSAIFFSLAFLNAIPPILLFEIMVVGFVLKVMIGLLGLPALYLTGWVKKGL
jgi:queuosine precursor transporter